MLIKMVNSVGEHAAGGEYDLPDEVADVYILKGYAEGKLSRAYTSAEVAEIQAEDQQVSF